MLNIDYDQNDYHAPHYRSALAKCFLSLSMNIDYICENDQTNSLLKFAKGAQNIPLKLLMLNCNKWK